VIKSPEEGRYFFENTLNMAKWRFQDDELIWKPVKTRWGMSPQTVNAYYNPSYEIVFPAAILQPPYNTKQMKL
jgi:endothelin-converting enzyme/putative endopeptidase